MTGETTIDARTNLDELVTRYPATAAVFVAHRMHCVGCDIARFETVEDACRIYRIPLDALLAALRRAAASGGGPGRAAPDA
ncbi:MAG: DUF1858 domain-containing protein [Thermomicrobiaceae bacterium]|nr:DUF1858 domain-containing protein [Thermomicrobiaceae bacterium]